jgi:hypothetical protein
MSCPHIIGWPVVSCANPSGCITPILALIQQHKPLLFFKNGKSKRWIGGDVVDSDRRIITTFAWPAEVVCDPFMGVGQFGVACLESVRLFIGMEADEGKFADARTRLALTDQRCKHIFQTCGCVLLDLSDGTAPSPLHSCRPHALELQKQKSKESARLKRLAESHSQQPLLINEARPTARLPDNS